MLLRTKNISFQYARGKSLNFADIELALGEHLAIVGNSGCGKTTLMHLLSGLLKPMSGEIFWGEKNIVKLSQAQLDNFRGKTMGIAFQQSFLVRSLTVAENIAAVCFFAGVKFDKKYITTLSEILSVQNLQNKYPSELSGGERQRVCLLRALAHRPKVVFADEPTANLDDKHATDLINLLFSSAQASGSSIIIVTHDQRIKPYFEKKIALV